VRNLAVALRPTHHIAQVVVLKHYPKEKRLRSLARRAGVEVDKAMSKGQREKAYHFMRRMYRLLNVVASLREQEATNA
jgi:hypothetical protein